MLWYDVRTWDGGRSCRMWLWEHNKRTIKEHDILVMHLICNVMLWNIRERSYSSYKQLFLQPLVVLFRVKSQSAVIMLLGTQTHGSKFLHPRRKECFRRPGAEARCGSVRAKARLKDLVCATCGRAVPLNSPHTSPQIHNPWRAWAWKIPERPSRGGERSRGR